MVRSSERYLASLRSEPMDPTSGPSPRSDGEQSPSPIRWYSRSALDEFLVAADAERSRLNGLIGGAHSRLARANSAIGLHQTMVEMLIDSQREIGEVRSKAEIEAAAIIARGQEEAEAILRQASPTSAARGHATSYPDGGISAEPRRPDDQHDLPGNGSALHGYDDQFFMMLKDELGGVDRMGTFTDE